MRQRLATIEDHLNSLSNELDSLKRQGDQLIIREILGAYDAIEDAIKSKNAETISSRLRFAEESLLRNTNLDPELTTLGQKNSLWMIYSHLGLAFVAGLREDAHIAVSHLLRIFIIDPRTARQKLIKEFYCEYFEPTFSATNETYQAKLAALDEELPQLEVAIKDIIKIGGLIAAALIPKFLSVGTYLLLGETARMNIQKALSLPPERAAKEIVSVIRSYRRLVLSGDYERTLDGECTALALKMLKEI